MVTIIADINIHVDNLRRLWGLIFLMDLYVPRACVMGKMSDDNQIISSFKSLYLCVFDLNVCETRHDMGTKFFSAGVI